jgi:hypothetical protein
MSDWQSVKTPPQEPMTVVFYSSDEAVPSWFRPHRDTRADLGFWDGFEWCWLMTGHRVWEYPEDYTDPDLPTHWKPLDPPKVQP